MTSNCVGTANVNDENVTVFEIYLTDKEIEDLRNQNPPTELATKIVESKDAATE